MVPYAVFILVFAAVAVLAYVGLDTVFSEEQQVTRRLRRMSDYETAQAKEVEPLLKPFRERVLAPTVAGVRHTARAIAPHEYVQSLRKRLRMAGNPNGIDAERLITAKVLGAIGVAGLFIGVTVFRPLSAASWIVAVVPLTVLTFFAPDLWLSARVSNRQLAIRRSLPDMLDMLTISVEAGLGFDQAMAKLVRNTSGPLAEEFARVLQEIGAGVDRGDALKHLGERTEVSELDGFIMAIVQAEVFGISISKVLRTQAGEMRIKRRQFAEEQAQKAPVKLVFPLVLCILPATLIVILGPAIVSFVRVFGG